MSLEKKHVQNAVVRVVKSNGGLALSTYDFTYRGPMRASGNGEKKTAGTMPTKGLPDTFYWIDDNQHGFIEHKHGKKSFSFDQISEEQWDWANTWTHLGPYWFGVGMGTEKVNRKDELRRRLFIIPKSVMEDTMATMEEQAGLKSIPMIGSFSNRVACRDKENGGSGLNAVNVWREYELFWCDGTWHFPETHPFYIKHLKETGHNDSKSNGNTSTTNSGGTGTGSSKFSNRDIAGQTCSNDPAFRESGTDKQDRQNSCDLVGVQPVNVAS